MASETDYAWGIVALFGGGVVFGGPVAVGEHSVAVELILVFTFAIKVGILKVFVSMYAIGLYPLRMI